MQVNILGFVVIGFKKECRQLLVILTETSRENSEVPPLRSSLAEPSVNIEGPLKRKKRRYQDFNCILLARKCICTSEMPLVGIFCPALCSKLWGAFSKIFKTCLKYIRQYLVSNFFYLLCFPTAVISRPELTSYIEKHFFKVQKQSLY